MTSQHESMAVPPLAPKSVPRYRGLWAAVGAGIVWAAIGQGSGELIWWPYLTAKYGGHFLYLVLPAAILGLIVNQEIIRYTATTGESIMTGFARVHRAAAWVLWIGMVITFMWFGGYASAGGTALAELTGFPSGWDVRSQSLFWAYSCIAVFLLPLVLGKVVYQAVEMILRVVAIATVVLLLIAVFASGAHSKVPQFLSAITSPSFSLPSNWDASDMTILVTAVTFTGMGGYLSLMYSYWLRDKQFGMASHAGRITSPITGKSEAIPQFGFAPKDADEDAREFRKWRSALRMDNAIGVGINTFTLLLLCLLSFVILAPAGEVPQGWALASKQSLIFAEAMGSFGRVLFLIIAAIFLADTWLGLTDAVSRMNSDFLTVHVPAVRRFGVRNTYYATVGLLTVVTCTTMLLEQPGPLILLGGILNFAASVVYLPLLLILNYKILPKVVPAYARVGGLGPWPLILATGTYTALAIWYVFAKFG